MAIDSSSARCCACGRIASFMHYTLCCSGSVCSECAKCDGDLICLACSGPLAIDAAMVSVAHVFPSQKPVPDQEAASTQSDAPLLTLPAELRNRIWELSLLSPPEGYQVDTDEIIIDASFKPPGLLSSCREIRQEVQCMYFQQVNFTFHLQDCDGELYIKWMTAFGPFILGVEGARMVNLGTGDNIYADFCGAPNWQNLVKLIKALFETKVYNAFKAVANDYSFPDEREHVIEPAFDMLRIAEAKKLSWKDLEEMLEPLHRVAMLVDLRWR